MLNTAVWQESKTSEKLSAQLSSDGFGNTTAIDSFTPMKAARMRLIEQYLNTRNSRVSIVTPAEMADTTFKANLLVDLKQTKAKGTRLTLTQDYLVHYFSISVFHF